jgi:hypothetical protein
MRNDAEIVAFGKALLLKYLARRQETVITAMIELCPEFILYEGLNFVFKIPDLETKAKVSRQRYERGETKFRGIWANEWEYRLHGIGCELKNLLTGEMFDWDISNPNTFLTGEFYFHLLWRCKNQRDDKSIKQYVEWVDQENGNHIILLELLARTGVIHRMSEFEWTI